MFAYCNNNPIAFLDHSGTFLGTLIGAIVGAAVGALNAAIEGEDVGAAALAGATSGAIAGLAADVLAITGGTGIVVIGVMGVASAAGSAAGSIVEAKVKNEPVDMGKLIEDAVWDGACGALFGYMGGPIKSQLGKVAEKGLGQVIKQTFVNNIFKKSREALAEEALSCAVASVARFTVGYFSFIVKELAK